MNPLQVGGWSISKGKLKQKWAAMTVDDLKYLDGRKVGLAGQTQKRAAMPCEPGGRIIKGFSSSSD